MNFLKLSIFSLLVIALASCGNDDDGPATCTQSDWVGTYVGTIACDGAVEDVTVTITANGAAALNFSYETATTSLEITDPVTPVGCDLDATATDAGFTITVDAMLNGDNLTYKEVFSDGTISTTCDLTATRK